MFPALMNIQQYVSVCIGQTENFDICLRTHSFSKNFVARIDTPIMRVGDPLRGSLFFRLEKS